MDKIFNKKRDAPPRRTEHGGRPRTEHDHGGRKKITLRSILSTTLCGSCLKSNPVTRVHPVTLSTPDIILSSGSKVTTNLNKVPS